MKLWILVLCAVAAGVSAQNDEALDWNDGWNYDYNEEWYRTQLEKLGIYNDEQKDASKDSPAEFGKLEKDQDEIDKKVEEEIKNFQEVEDEKIDDYQFEDNRSEQNEKLGEENNAEPIHDNDDGNNENASVSASEDDYDDYALKVENDFEMNLPEEEDFEPQHKISKDGWMVPLPFSQSNNELKQIMDETQAILKDEEKEPNEFKETMQESDEIIRIMEETKAILDGENKNSNDFANDEPVQEIGKIMEGTKDNLGDAIETPINPAAYETNEDDENLDSSDDTVEKQIDDNLNDNIVDTDYDTVDKVYEDLNDDLDKLFETLDKLTKNENEDEEKVKPADVDYAVNSDEALESKSDYENIFDSNLSELFAEHSKVLDSENHRNMKAEVKDNDNERGDEQIQDSPKEEAKESAEPVLELHPYIDDALPSDSNDEQKLVKSADELSDDQLDQLMEDFKIQHNDAFEIDSKAGVDHVVNEITLEYGVAKVITSDNYPAAYPTNRIVDWIITCNGQGIELNLTDFAVNSALGDYLMIKPGQSDDSGSEGLIFSYHLNQPRAFRFIDVDKVFIRFDSKPGFSFLRGFSLALNVVAPLTLEEPEPEPEPQPVLPEPRDTLAVMLGGLTLTEFQEKREDFRLLIADMATMYINANGIEPGMNTTAEITQLVSASICNLHWPGYEQCSHVRFSVPLVYEDVDEDERRLNETDLQTMWDTYVNLDPFAARLRQMGIEEFSVPNDSGVLTVWLVVALGVVVSAAMLAFALWRYSCFEDYSRMPAYSDTDSLQEKRSSALYPTPHQMLPPLYAENDYDSTRVDMGGFANRSYTRTDMYDLDSEEEVVVTRDRNAAIQPRDVFSV